MRTSKNFYTIKNNIIFNKEYTMEKIKPEGYAIYSFLKLRQKGSSSCDVNIKTIIAYFNNSKQLYVKYPQEKKVSRLKTTRTVRPYLIKLIKDGYIEVLNDINIDKIGINDTLIYAVKDDDLSMGNFTMFNNDLFLDYIGKIGHNGWTIYSLLYTLHNKDFGGKFNEGFATPTEKTIEKITTLSYRTIRAYIGLLEELKLIKVIKNSPILLEGEVDANGRQLYKNVPNNYIVNARLQNNKYNVF